MPFRPRPLIAITPDIAEPSSGGGGKVRIQCAATYTRAVAEAGGHPVVLAPDESLIADQLRTFHGFILTGGDDPRTEPFGEPTHPQATPVHDLRQRYETALIRALLANSDIPAPPILGICLGMQMLALVSGGKLNQHMPDTLSPEQASRHRHDARHVVVPAAAAPPWLSRADVTSHHRQCVTDPGTLKVAATSDDASPLIEAVIHPTHPFCLGVQWHPERTPDSTLGSQVFTHFMAAARRYGQTVG